MVVIINAPSLNVSVILFHKVVQVLTLPDGDGPFIRFTGIECDQRRCVGACGQSAVNSLHPTKPQAGCF